MGTPVLVGIGQYSERLGDSTYEGLSPAAIAARAAELALADAGIGPAEVDVLACTRQFDESFPGLPSALGSPDNFPRAVANRIEADPARCIYAVTGGQFSLLPTNNASGNFTKVVQRIPVKILVEDPNHELKPGMSAVIDIDARQK